VLTFTGTSAVCVANKREYNLLLTDDSKYDWILWQYGPGEKTRQENFLGLGNSYAWHRLIRKYPPVWKWLGTEYTKEK
jgi:hypothetical protein